MDEFNLTHPETKKEGACLKNIKIRFKQQSDCENFIILNTRLSQNSMINYPDIELHKHLQRLAEDDAGAMSFLYIRYAGKIKGLALRLLGNVEDARDVAQDVFMHLWELRHQLADVESLDAFIFRMAHNATINRLQHRVVVQRFE